MVFKLKKNKTNLFSSPFPNQPNPTLSHPPFRFPAAQPSGLENPNPAGPTRHPTYSPLSLTDAPGPPVTVIFFLRLLFPFLVPRTPPIMDAPTSVPPSSASPFELPP